MAHKAQGNIYLHLLVSYKEFYKGLTTDPFKSSFIKGLISKIHRTLTTQYKKTINPNFKMTDSHLSKEKHNR